MTKKAFVIGHPISHSISPVFQQAALDHCDIDAQYQAIDVNMEDLASMINTLRGQDVFGANITVPYKEKVIPLVDRLDCDASSMGAVNTIVNCDGVLVGHNTDGEGFLRALREEAQLELSSARVLVIGAGGAAKAIIWALADLGIRSLVVTNRTSDRAETVVESIGSRITDVSTVPMEFGPLKRVLDQTDILVNCTSVGMAGGPSPMGLPMPSGLISPNHLVFDLVYNPMETPLMSEATKVGARVMGGLSMLVYQGAVSFELWTKQDAPINEMFLAAESALHQRQTLIN